MTVDAELRKLTRRVAAADDEDARRELVRKLERLDRKLEACS